MIDDVLAALDGVRRNGDGWRARCPAHADKDPSLSITEGDDRRVLVRCFAGCDFDAICEATGLPRSAFAPPPSNGNAQRRIVAAYPYVDEAGTLLFEALRYSPKDFRQRRPDGKGGHIYNLQGVRRVLYRLNELAAADAGSVVVKVEGERDADALAERGFRATCNPMGAGKWRDEYAETLAPFHVVVIPDADEPGRAHADAVARSCLGKAQSVKVVELPGGDSKKGYDVSDWFGDGHTADELRDLIETAPAYTPGPDCNTQTNKGDDGDEDEKKTQAQRIVELADAAGVELFHSGDEAFACVPVGEHAENMRVRSKAFRQWLSRSYYLEHERPPGSQPLQDALGVLSGRALFDGAEQAVFVRVAHTDDRIFVDLADAEWRAVEIDAEGWRIVSNPPVRFVRPRGMRPLPEPAKDGNASALFRFVNLDGDDSRALLLGWLVAAFSRGPYPPLALNGEQGSAKSTTCRMLRALVDPNAAPLRAEPREVRDLMVSAGGSWCVALDNLSRVSGWLSDALCRLSTGGGFSTRELYTDDEERIFDAQRPVILNGISELATRGDLLDRAVCLSLPAIPEDRRRTESDLWREFHAEAPRILGGVLDAVSQALRTVDDVRLGELPRMADFARWATAAEGALGLDPGAFMRAYAGNRADAVSLTVEASPIGVALQDFNEGDRFEGTATELLARLNARFGDSKRRPDGWPKSARALSDTVRRLAPALRRLGFVVEFEREPGKSRRRIIRLEKGCIPASEPSEPSDGAAGDPKNAVSSDECRTQADERRTHDRPTESRPGDPENADSDAADAADAEKQGFSNDEAAAWTNLDTFAGTMIDVLPVTVSPATTPTGWPPLRRRDHLLELAESCEATNAERAAELRAAVEQFDERAAVAEYDGGLSRAEAEAQAAYECFGAEALEAAAGGGAAA